MLKSSVRLIFSLLLYLEARKMFDVKYILPSWSGIYRILLLLLSLFVGGFQMQRRRIHLSNKWEM